MLDKNTKKIIKILRQVTGTYRIKKSVKQLVKNQVLTK